LTDRIDDQPASKTRETGNQSRQDGRQRRHDPKAILLAIRPEKSGFEYKNGGINMKHMKVPRGTARRIVRDKARNAWQRKAPKISLAHFIRSTKEKQCSSNS